METPANISTDDYVCNICNKIYKNKSGIWKHNNKYHSENQTPENANIRQNIIKTPPETAKNQQEISKEISCEYCNFIFTRKDSLLKHYNRCKFKNNNKEIKESDILELKKENAEIKSMLAELLKSSKIHPKTLQKINKNLINGNNNTLNSGIVNNNNTIQIVKFGSEDIKSILSTKEIKNILNCRYKAIEESIKKVHFNDDRPEYRNIYITNLRDNIAYVYNGNKFEAVQKHSIINQLIDQHMNNIEVSLEDYKDKLPERTIEILDKLIEKLQDDHTSMVDEENNKEFKNYRMFKINEVKLMIYNETGNNTEVIKLKYNNSIFNKPIKEIDV
jgi:uncharacterized C2H2 Zn-finger protein